MDDTLSAQELSRRTGLSDDELRAWQELGLLRADEQGGFTADAVERIRTIRFALQRGITAEQIAELAHAQQADVLGRYIDLLGGTRPLGRSVEEAAHAAGLPLPLARRFWIEIGRGDNEVFDDDLQMMRIAATALQLGLPEEALLQIVRVYADGLTRVADAESRLFHIHVHEQLRASTGLPEAELVEQVRAMSDPLMEMIEPSILYFHRRAWREAVLEDMVVHLREDLEPQTRGVGEVPVAVLFVDLSAFTPLTEAMGDTEAARVLDRFSHLVREAAGHCTGRVLKQIGDEFMIAFPNAPAAVRCGLAIRSRAATEPNFPAVRMGAHSGTALYREADYLGATVNIAARVASQAGRGEFIVTDVVMADCRDTPNAQFSAIGRRALKGVTEPVALFAVRDTDAAPRIRHVDPVCGMDLDEDHCEIHASWQDHDFFFCTEACRERFTDAPEHFAHPADPASPG